MVEPLGLQKDALDNIKKSMALPLQYDGSRTYCVRQKLKQASNKEITALLQQLSTSTLESQVIRADLL